MKTQPRLNALLHQPIKLRVTKRRVAMSLLMLLVFALLACYRAGIPHAEIALDLGDVAWERSLTHFLSDELWPHPFATRFKVKGVAYNMNEGMTFSMSYDRVAKTLEYQSEYGVWEGSPHMAIRHESFAWSGVEDWMLRDIARKAESPETFQRLNGEPYKCRFIRSRVWDEPLKLLSSHPAFIPSKPTR